jgi:recombination protein RecR
MDHSLPSPRHAAPSDQGGDFQSPALERLVRALSRLPGIGRKSATRIALELLTEDTDTAESLIESLAEARERVCNCSRCGAITETDPCSICTSLTREAALLCVVASPVDILPFEQAGFFRGRYFVLGRLLSPLDGVRVEDLPFQKLLKRLEEDNVQELILALDASVEGEATALYIQRLLESRELAITRLATGIPVGGSLVYTDSVTLQRAFQYRREF